ncbi:FAD/FMN-containing dehydrogenase [Nocardioides terrae]|uniref:FAD/FMN-containing dehydrogenase n=1 Tax=Nocardioides terrae TaxID=574651 RepID=A0A1I1KDA4_9ACTN|nr:FAD-binding oxidoreductase [Nocardioides terrae]SFC58756.1 FAD/FMN-containing dehydrogenase [Nocardioides terrae]
MHSLLPTLRRTLGDDAVLTDAADTAGYVTDWTGAFAGAALAVVRPADTAGVADTVRLCAQAGVAVVPQGGNTGLVGGAVPDGSGGDVVLSLERMRRVRGLDPVGDTITVEAGVVLRAVQERAEAAGRLFPLSLGSEGSCTVGGTVSTNAGGTAVLRYGMMRELVLGLEVVLPDGRVWDGLRALRKDNTGYDLKQLFIGAEGTLGIVTAAVLRLFPATPRRATALVALASADAATELLPLLRQECGGTLTTWELLGRQAMELVLTHVPGARDPFDSTHEWYGLVELAAGSDDVGERLEAALHAAAAQGLLLDAVIAGNPAQRTSLWTLREGLAEAQKLDGLSVKHDITVPISSLAGFVAEVGPRLRALLPGLRLVTYGHVGDGNLHYNLSAPVGDEAALRAAAGELTGLIYDAVAERGGSISAEHGLGVLKRGAAATYKSEVELDLMRAVKRALDPGALMNPGKVLP